MPKHMGNVNFSRFQLCRNSSGITDRHYQNIYLNIVNKFMCPKFQEPR